MTALLIALSVLGYIAVWVASALFTARNQLQKIARKNAAKLEEDRRLYPHMFRDNGPWERRLTAPLIDDQDRRDELGISALLCSVWPVTLPYFFLAGRMANQVRELTTPSLERERAMRVKRDSELAELREEVKRLKIEGGELL